MNRYRSLMILAAAVVLAGCGSGREELPRGTVKGRVTLSGKPVSDVTITYENDQIGVAQGAATDSDGKYEFITYDKVGLPAASYKVTVSSGRFLQPGEEFLKIEIGGDGKPVPPKKQPTPVPAKYAKRDTSGLSAEVKAGENEPFDFELTP